MLYKKEKKERKKERKKEQKWLLSELKEGLFLIELKVRPLGISSLHANAKGHNSEIYWCINSSLERRWCRILQIMFSLSNWGNISYIFKMRWHCLRGLTGIKLLSRRQTVLFFFKFDRPVSWLSYSETLFYYWVTGGRELAWNYLARLIIEQCVGESNIVQFLLIRNGGLVLIHLLPIYRIMLTLQICIFIHSARLISFRFVWQPTVLTVTRSPSPDFCPFISADNLVRAFSPALSYYPRQDHWMTLAEFDVTFLDLSEFMEWHWVNVTVRSFEIGLRRWFWSY